MLSQTTHLRRIFPLIFHTASTLSAPSGHLPLEGKAVCRGYRFPPPPSAPSGHLLPKEGGSIHASPFPWKGLLSVAVDRVLSYIAYLRRSPSLSFIPPVPYPPLRGTFPSRGRQCVGDSAFPPPTSAPSGHLLPKEGGSIHASPFPWKGLLSAARRGWLPFLRRSRLLNPEP